MFRISSLAYVGLGCVGFAAAAIEFVRGDAKNVMPLIVLGGVALAAALIKAMRSRG